MAGASLVGNRRFAASRVTPNERWILSALESAGGGEASRAAMGMGQAIYEVRADQCGRTTEPAARAGTRGCEPRGDGKARQAAERIGLAPVSLRMTAVTLRMTPVILYVTPVMLKMTSVILKMTPVILYVTPVMLRMTPVIL